MTAKFRTLLTACAAGALAFSLTACGPDDGQGTASSLFSPADSGLAPGWSMTDLAGVDPAFYGDDYDALPEALPMAASYDGDYSYAPSYDYAPDYDDRDYAPLDDSYYYDDGAYDHGYYEDGYYDGGYYDDAHYDDGYGDGFYDLDSDTNDYALLALAVSLTGMLGDAPPDYGFAYDGARPWAWHTGDRYYRYAEPIDGGYRYYYYEPDAYRPFLVSDPYYSYGYRDDRLVAVYDRGGRRIDARRAQVQQHAAKAYYARAERLYRASQHDRYGVAAPLWSRHRDEIARDRNDWVHKQVERPAWQRWETRNGDRLKRQWSNEAIVRRDAENRFDGWQRADFRTPAPKFYTQDVRKEQVRKLVEVRRDRASEIAERQRERTEQRSEQRRETRQLAERAQKAEQQRERATQVAERRPEPAQRVGRVERRERGIAISEIPARVEPRREAPAASAQQRREQRPVVARQDRPQRTAPQARPEQARPRVAERQAAPQPQARREQARSAMPKRTQPEARQQVRREPAVRAPEPERPAQVSRQARPQPAKPQQERSKPQARVERPEPRQQARQARVERPQPERPQPQARALRQESRPEPRQAQARPERVQPERPQPREARIERQQPERQQRQEQARAPRPDPQPRLAQAREARQPAAQPARPEPQEARQKPGRDKPERPNPRGRDREQS
jgi:hypothetical protein